MQLILAFPLITNIQLAQRFVQAWARKSLTDLLTKAWQEYHSEFQ
jgi:hypothetical protein